jgi:hypothetical protein
MYIPPVAHVLPLTSIRRQRTLPVPGTITVHLNERVQPQDIIAEAEVAPQHKFIDVAQGLGLPVREVSRYLVRERGERVIKGDLIAGPAGFPRKSIKAPTDGRIAAITNGKVLFEFRKDPFVLTAGIPGEVVATDGMMSVTIETSGALIQGVWGNNRQDFGVMRIVGTGPRDRLLTDQLDIKLRGAVLVAGICDDPAPLHHAKELSVRGIILGGLAADMVPIALSMPYPIVVLDGFGSIPLNQAAFELINANRGRDAALDGRPMKAYDSHRPEVVIPLPVVNPTDMPEDLIPLSPGTRVKVTRAPNASEIGIVEEVLDQVMSYPNGVLTKSARVNLEFTGSTFVPLANLEILQ